MAVHALFDRTTVSKYYGGSALFRALRCSGRIRKMRAIITPLLLLRPHIRPPATAVVTQPRFAAAVASIANDTLTVGDVLAGSISRQIDELPKEEQQWRAEWMLDALLESSSSELSALERDLTRDLRSAEADTLGKLRDAGLRNGELFDKAFNHSESALASWLSPTREAVRADLTRHLAEDEERRDRERRQRNALSGFARSSSWRDTTALARSLAQPKHPVVRLAETTALTLSLMMMISFGDFATATHRITRPPPRVARVRMHKPRRTAEPPPERVIVAPAASPVERQARPREPASRQLPWDGAASAHSLDAREGFWAATRTVAMVWAASFASIVLRSGSDEWAAIALGLEPCDSVGLLGANATGTGGTASATTRTTISYSYDWQRDAWREV